MRKIFSLFLAGCLLLMLPATVWASEGTTYESEQGQAMIKAPSSAKDKTDTDNDAASDDEEEGALSAPDSSSGIDWSAANTAGTPTSASRQFIVCIDPGHQGSWVDMSAQEPMAPGSSQTKNKATTGTSGNFSKVPEYEVNLQVSLVLRKELESRGYKVIMTREDNDKAISNKERAELATEANADITVRIHANSDNSASAAGALTMAPTTSNQYLDQDLIEKSNTLASCIINSYCAATGLANKGVISADNMTGTNWSTVPVTILEMGFMSNQNDDLYITNSANHETMAKGIADGIDAYFQTVEPDIAAMGEHLAELTESLQKTYTDPLEAKGETWAIAAMDLTTQAYSTIHAEQSMQSASVIKVFIMAAVYDRLVYPDEGTTISSDYESTLKPLLTSMITVSDNSAANELVRKLGGGDFQAGAAVVNEFCQEHNYTATHLGREFLAKDPTDDNYTSASDCCRLLSEIYTNSLVNADASAEMLALLQAQTKTAKIPAGVPSGIATANKTGELTASDKLGVVENDIAIVFDKDHPYVLCVLSNNIQNNTSAQDTIKKISSDVYTYMTTKQK
ncbi:serine hydrolase [Blautia sp. MSJ-19]|uniref:serine hydrolase n=1 Tax=Blautia sp. MSJ-19 TaxID=2841517 RepID=UPI001C0EEBAF|nr:serine hydrolase [Blautia sp. MSJ-19]MBU5480447.1 N-acetylmuramoyl-L-alanine amidase [Blautia sp. MSJ-19]